jgi:hypothetical protein
VIRRPHSRDADRMNNRDEDSSRREALGRLALSVLLYLAGDPDVVRVVHTGRKPAVKDSLRSREPERY